MTYARLSLLSACLLGTLACDLGPKAIGNDVGDGDGDTGDGDGDGEGNCDTEMDDANCVPNPFDDQCGAETTTIVTDLEATLPGFDTSALELLAQAEGSYVGDFTWAANDGPVTIPHAGTTSPLTMAVAHEGGEIRLTEVEFAGGFPNGQNGGQPCSNRVEIDVALDFVTDDGLFNESMTVPLLHASHQDEFFPKNPNLYFTLDFDAHQGALAFTDFNFADAVVRDIFLLADFSGTDVTGSVAMEVETMDWIGFGIVAEFSAVRQP